MVVSKGMVTTRLLTEDTREAIQTGELLKALLQTSADLELLFFSKLLFEKGIKKNLMKNWTLGRYFEWVSKLGLIDKKYNKLLKDFNETRNMIVHGRYIIHSIEKYPRKIQYLKNLLLAVCNFIDATPVTYTYDQGMEEEYARFSEKMRRKYDRFIANANREGST